MRLRSFALAALVGGTLCCPILVRASVEGDALLFLDSQVLPRKAAACSARISGFSSQFEPVFRAWLTANRSRIAAGEAYLRADAEKTRTPLERDVQSIAGNISQQWNAAPLSTLQENCDAMLVQLKEAPDGE
jgi:hypothetical protein